MKTETTPLKDLLILTPSVFTDARGFFFESYNQHAFEEATGRKVSFVQDNHTLSQTHVLRGLHYQLQNTQAKLVRVLKGRIFDVAVDLRKASPSFGKWFGIELSAENKKQAWIPEGFAHGFLSLEDGTEVLYKVNDFYAPDHQRCLRWDDPAVGIKWPIKSNPILSPADNNGSDFDKLDLFP